MIPKTIIEAILYGANATFLISNIGNNIILKTINITSDTIIKLTQEIVGKKEIKYKEVKERIEKIDINFKISIIKEILKEQEEESKGKENEMKESKKRCILGITKIMLEIEEELKKIIKSIKEHEELYFNEWRGFKCKGDIKKIEKKMRILESRYKTMIEIIKIYKK